MKTHFIWKFLSDNRKFAISFLHSFNFDNMTDIWVLISQNNVKDYLWYNFAISAPIIEVINKLLKYVLTN